MATRSLIIIFALLCSACSSWVYVPDLNQGNIINQDDVDRLEPGMSKRFVEVIMGSPAIVDPFHPDRWVYINMVKPRFGDTRKRELVLFFENDQLVRFEGDYRPGAEAPGEETPDPGPITAG
jgi:outer membrane protein assembly factor BamE